MSISSPTLSNVSGSSSPLELFNRLSREEQQTWLASLSEQQKADLAYEWDRWQARPQQLPPPDPWRFWLIMAGRGYGKTRVGAEETRKAAKRIRFPNIIGATADDARDIMIEGESGILAICPKHERPTYRASKRQLEWPSGAKSLIFTADEPERLRGKQHEWLWADELAAWRYPEAWDQAMLGLRLGANPQAVITTTPKPTRLIRDLIADPNCRVTRGRTYDNLQNLAPAFAAEIIRKYEGTRLGRQELEGELLEDEGMAYRFDERIHTVPSFEVPAYWTRGEGMDFGSSAPTAWLVFATDEDGNHVCFDEFYLPGMPSETAPEILKRRSKDYLPQSWQAYQDGWPVSRNVVWGDPASMANRPPIAGRFGNRTSIGQEFADCGVPVTPANNARDAGYIRIAELLRQDPERRFPSWHPRAGDTGSPRLFFFADRCVNVVEQLKDAIIEDKGSHVGMAVNGDWESSHGHAHAALRYWALSRVSPSKAPEPEITDPRQAMLVRRRKRLESGEFWRDRDHDLDVLEDF